MTITRRHPAALLIAPLALVATLLAFTAAPAHADVGVERASTHHGAPGATIDLTLGCGFCFPPCVGPKRERHPKGFDHGPCMLGTKLDPPASFGISLVRSKEAPQRRTCGDAPVCTPTPLGPPHKAPFTFIGRPCRRRPATTRKAATRPATDSASPSPTSPPAPTPTRSGAGSAPGAAAAP